MGDVIELEIKQGENITLVKKNSLFAFDNIEVERSTSIGVPATPRNNKSLSFAGDVHNNGEAMRKRYAAQMQSGAVAKNGYLYFDKYDDGDFEAVFIAGDLLGLKKLREAGTLRELYTPKAGEEYDDWTYYPTTQPKSASASPSYIWAAVNYMSATGHKPRPSYNLTKIAAKVCEDLGVTCTMPAGTDLRVIVNAPNTAWEDTVDFRISQSNTPYGTDGEWIEHIPVVEQLVIYSGTWLTRMLRRVSRVNKAYTVERGGTPYPVYGFRGAFEAQTDINLHFSDDTPTIWCLVDFDPDASVENKQSIKRSSSAGSVNIDVFDEITVAVRGVRFLDEYRVNVPDGVQTSPTFIVEGSPLAGRTVKINRGQTFSIVNIDEYTSVDRGDNYVNRWYKIDTPEDGYRSYIISGVTISNAKNNVEPNDEEQQVTLSGNLPDISVVDALKIIAACSGTLLRYDAENNAVVFDEGNPSTWGVKNIDGKVIELGNVRRTFADYTQRNIIGFDSAENVAAPLRVSYDIDNTNLQAKKELLTINFSEGDVTGNGLLYIDDAKQEMGKNTIAAGGTGTYLQRVNMPLVAGLVNLCEVSTAVTITASLSLLEYEQITEKTLIEYNGARYVWLEIDWADNTATLELNKI